MADFILFGTQGCHLCEDAERLLMQLRMEYQLKDVIENVQWQERYALKIPVLLHVRSQRQLDWPFDAQQLQTFYDETELK